MLSIERCQEILNQAAPEGVRYTRRQTELLRSVLYQIARLHLEIIRKKHDDEPER